MKNILLAAGGHRGLLVSGPLFAALEQSGSFNVSLVSSEPPTADMALCFGFTAAASRVVDCGSPCTLARSLAAMDEAITAAGPDLVIVCGSDAPALGAALAAAELGLPVASSDAGLRSYDRGEVEEIRRMLIDTVASMYIVSEHSGEYNLINEGIAEEGVMFAGNLVIDALRAFMERGGAAPLAASLGLKPKQYALVLPDENGGNGFEDALLLMLAGLSAATDVLVMLPDGAPSSAVLRQRLEGMARVHVTELPAYGDLLILLRDASLLLQGSGVLAAEATVMNVPCMTMRERTERPSTLEIGSNVLVGLDVEEASARMLESLRVKKDEARRSKIPEKWDGAAASRISAWLEERLDD
ncbi:UDP-N-acetylglucosamine 2-epimerase [Pelodictyon luteolum]|uniref:UDP-N-acetylglucosamine 2-epimerase, putative n=1 Tax=Chlorobium luteolum (strain DSM 273 / BCRC 81028 / 2530) TaxID=319225 RepID=Q3B1A5_CHLL3|nr:UDP-N-acetylglucosamine 2-epimerase [Pelodictyon luteolum]ABB24876.1 UDP-N-acetylglucosamine 2-epimerase, putative [Pelodictyon luteolum DSM 273]